MWAFLYIKVCPFSWIWKIGFMIRPVCIFSSRSYFPRHILSSLLQRPYIILMLPLSVSCSCQIHVWIWGVISERICSVSPSESVLTGNVKVWSILWQNSYSPKTLLLLLLVMFAGCTGSFVCCFVYLISSFITTYKLLYGVWKLCVGGMSTSSWMCRSHKNLLDKCSTSD